MGSISLGARCDASRMSLDTRQAEQTNQEEHVSRHIYDGIFVVAFRFSDSKHFIYGNTRWICERVMR